MTTKATEVQAPAPPPTPAPGEINGHCPLTQIRPSPFNVRKVFDETDIAELAASIRAIGLTERLLVRPRGADGAVPQYEKGRWYDLDHFELVDGERRYRALSLLNETHAVDRVPIVIRDMTDDQVRAVMLATREQSRDLAASELVAGYRELAEGRTADEVAAMVGRSPGHVRSVLRLAKLPAWALAAVDAGTLPRATAELVARVPGEESRKRAAACVLLGFVTPNELRDGWEANVARATASPLTYRETKQLLQLHFTRELKGCPFDRKSLDLLPEAGSCDACPKRAGNDADATEEGVRADTCLDPDCYREKVKAYKATELARAAEKGIEDADLGVEGFGNPPRGWCDLNQPAWQTDLHDAFPIGPKQDPKREEKLGKLLGKACPQRYLAFGSNGKAVTLVKTAEARKALVELGVIKKEEKKAATKATPAPPSVDRTKEEEARKLDALVEKEVARRCMATVATKIEETAELLFTSPGGHDSTQVLRLLLAGVIDASVADVGREIAKRRGVSPDKVTTIPAALDGAALLGLLGELVAGRKLLGWQDGRSDKAFWSHFGINITAVEKQARRELSKGAQHGSL